MSYLPTRRSSLTTDLRLKGQTTVALVNLHYCLLSKIVKRDKPWFVINSVRVRRVRSVRLSIQINVKLINKLFKFISI